MPALPQPPATRPSTRPGCAPPSPARPGPLPPRRPSTTAVVARADKMCRDVVSAPKDRPVVEGVATVRFLGADGAAIDVECAKVWREKWEAEEWGRGGEAAKERRGSARSGAPPPPPPTSPSFSLSLTLS